MPELPDLTIYLRALGPRVLGQPIQSVRLRSPFVVRSVETPIHDVEGRRVRDVGRLGKRLVLSLDGDLHILLHLMVAGRLRWKKRNTTVPKKRGLVAFDFPDGTLLLTEASSRQRASIHVVTGSADLARYDRGGLEVLEASLEQFREVMTRENHTLKRALTDPRILAGIGNAYSDEILHAARLSPLLLTSKLSEVATERLFLATRHTLTDWIDRLQREVGDQFPDKVTAFRDGMAVHGRYRQPCPVCRSPVQRIRYAENEVNYCASCQTGGRVYADRALSRLLKDDWPRSLDDWEERLGQRPE